MSKVIYNLLWRKVCHNSEPPRRADPRELKRPKRTNIVLFSSYFFSSDHVGISTVAAIATRVPHSGKCVVLFLIVLKKGWVALILNGM